LLATGNISEPVQRLHLADASALVQAYETAFDRLLIVLATITMLTAIVVFLGLRRGSAPEQDIAPLPACQEG
ncbi:MAG: MFS transporter, partial [Mesorhizobium sp.]